jgi:GNAT superfamily N-acetyltransferase
MIMRTSLSRGTAAELESPFALPGTASDEPDMTWRVELRNGAEVLIRPICDDDLEMERQFIEGLSPQSRRFRFLGEVKTPGAALLKQFTHLDPSRDVAFIALSNDGVATQEVGVSRYSTLTNGSSCECAVAVSDDWQHEGLGTLLMQHLIEVARERGIESMYSIDASDNHAMRELAEYLGFVSRPDPSNPAQVVHTLKLQVAALPANERAGLHPSPL